MWWKFAGTSFRWFVATVTGLAIWVKVYLVSDKAHIAAGVRGWDDDITATLLAPVLLWALVVLAVSQVTLMVAGERPALKEVCRYVRAASVALFTVSPMLLFAMWSR